MEEILNYNFYSEDLKDKNFTALFNERRRDAAFAFVFKDEEGTYLVRDHLGTCPLWYRRVNDDWKFSTNLADISKPSDFTELGLKSYLSLGTTKVSPLFSNIHSVPPGTVIFIGEDNVPEIIYQYQVTPKTKSFFSSYRSEVDSLEVLFKTALQKQLRNKKSASLYLSGGIDSALIGLYLKELGIEITTYTALKGTKDEEDKCLETNLEAIQPKGSHIIRITEDYDELLDKSFHHHKQPCGNTTVLAVASLWEKSSIKESSIVFNGQNSDVISNAMDNSHASTFGFPRPAGLINHSEVSLDNMFSRYMSKCSKGLLAEDPLNLGERYKDQNLSSFQLLAIAGMYLRRTPVDGELLSQPAINNSIAIGNPFYDMDVVEFLLGLSLRHKFCLKKNSRIPVSLDKRVLQSLALAKGLPAELVYRKKGFTVSKQRNYQAFFEKLPTEFNGIKCQTENQRFAAYVLEKYLVKSKNDQ